MQPHLSVSKELWKNFLKKEDLAIDATCGNGYDTLFLADLCCCIGLDIQIKALENSKKLLEASGKTAEFHLLSHAKIDELSLLKPPTLIVFNLGFLPRCDKKITTMTSTTLISVQKSLEILAPRGALSITCYPGHEEGKKEEEALLAWAMGLKKEKWLSCHYRWVNRVNAPSLFWISSN